MNTPGTRERWQESSMTAPVNLVQEGMGEVIKGTSAAVAPVALQSWPVVVRAPVPNVVALTPGTVQRTLFPPQGMDIRLTVSALKSWWK